MMKSNRLYTYSDISTFNDFRIQEEHLLMKKKMLEASLNLRFEQLGRIFSLSGSIVSLAKEMIRPKIASLFDWLLKKLGN
jgi:hypothetical protein